MFSKSEPCGKPEDIPHSKVVGSSFNFNDRLRYECIKGFTLTGPRLRTCGDDGKWSEAPRCEGNSYVLSFVYEPLEECLEVRREGMRVVRA